MSVNTESGLLYNLPPEVSRKRSREEQFIASAEDVAPLLQQYQFEIDWIVYEEIENEIGREAEARSQNFGGRHWRRCYEESEGERRTDSGKAEFGDQGTRL
ncbi:PREDICTED: uncharacterized protein LOC109169481 [Ipomoea nil]|uniref:uncharacterized protein LOC109169481 n=1 Tax=Ipomoea nil TaxID=35883 RepID=UPI00090087C9|nr:PREDICTED: uncharacterized protein LOC109169481 [Ipomoea nil]